MKSIEKRARNLKLFYWSMLGFPIKEMRDAFYENFKELINDCKELL